MNIDPATGRLQVEDVELLHSVLGGDPVTEGMILKFISDRYGAESLLYLAPKVAEQILRRPTDFIRAAKKHCQLGLGF